jgi:hypothetical protein
MRHAFLVTCIAAALFPLANLAFWHGKTDNDERSSVEELLQRVQASTDVRTSGSQPFRMKAIVKFFDESGQTRDGTYELLWQTPTLWRDELKFADFSQVRLASGEKLFVSRNPKALSLEVFHLLSLLEFPKSVRLALQGTTLSKQQELDRNGRRET